jgi:hypothetical protein
MPVNKEDTDYDPNKLIPIMDAIFGYNNNPTPLAPIQKTIIKSYFPFTYYPNIQDNYDQAAQLIRKLNGTIINYNDWIRMGIALKNEFGERGLSLWLLFADNSAYQDTEEELIKKWNSFPITDDVHFGTFIYLTKKYLKNEITYNGEKTMQYNSIQPITEQNELPEPIIGGNKQESKFNVDLLPDFLKDYVGIAQKGCNASAKALVASLLPVISIQLGNNVYMVNNSHKIYPNLWVILIGPSSQSQKSTAANMAMSTLGPYIKSLENKSETDNKRLNPIIGNVTKTKLGSMLKENPCRLLFLNEFGNFMELAFSYGNKGMIQTLTELYDSNEYNYKSMNNDINPKDCALSFLSCCTDSYIQNLFKTNADQNSGFLQRILYCIISPSSENTDITFKDNTACAEEIENYEKIFNLFRNIPGPFEIKLSESANKYATDYVNFRKNEIIDKYGMLSGLMALEFILKLF